MGDWQIWLDHVSVALGWLGVWLSGPFWTFINTPFMSGLIPAMVGLLLSRRIAEVAENNKDAEVIRSAEAQIAEIDRSQDVQDLKTAVDDAAPAQPALHATPDGLAAQAGSPFPDDLVGLPDDVVAQLDEKIERIKVELGHRIRELDGRRARKYENITRYDYRPIVLMLARDQALTDDEAYSLIEIFTVWTGHRKKKRMLPQEKADLILNFRLSRRLKRNAKALKIPPETQAPEQPTSE